MILQLIINSTFMCDIKTSSFFSKIDAKNKPSAILIEKGTVKIRQTASQVWCLLRLLPFMIGKFIPQGDSRWEVFLLLRHIVEYLFRPSFTEATTFVLADLIEQHHSKFLEVGLLLIHSSTITNTFNNSIDNFQLNTRVVAIPCCKRVLL